VSLNIVCQHSSIDFSLRTRYMGKQAFATAKKRGLKLPMVT
jgi:hypothetical protein